MEYTQLTSQQLELLEYLEFTLEDVKEIDHFDQYDMPVDKDGYIMLGNNEYEDPDKYYGKVVSYDLDEDVVEEVEVASTDVVKKSYDDDFEDRYSRYYGYGSYYERGGSDKSSVYVPVKCHEGTKQVFAKDGIIFYGAGASRGGKFWPAAIVIDLADVIPVNVEIFGLSMPSITDNYIQPCIKLDWKDFGAPSLPKAFWLILVEELKRIRDERGGELEVIVCCQGGHGRTGTALSIFAVLMGVVPDGECPVQFVRDAYCSNAVESEDQTEYITEVTGREVITKVSKWERWSLTSNKSTVTDKKEEKK